MYWLHRIPCHKWLHLLDERLMSELHRFIPSIAVVAWEKKIVYSSTGGIITNDRRILISHSQLISLFPHCCFSRIISIRLFSTSFASFIFSHLFVAFQHYHPAVAQTLSHTHTHTYFECIDALVYGWWVECIVVSCAPATILWQVKCD